MPTVAMYQARVKEVLDLTDENDRLSTALRGINRFCLVIESAVREREPTHHREVLAALKAVKAAASDVREIVAEMEG